MLCKETATFSNPLMHLKWLSYVNSGTDFFKSIDRYESVDDFLKILILSPHCPNSEVFFPATLNFRLL